MYAVTNTRTRIDEVNGIRKNVFLTTEFIGCFETLEEAQEAVANFTEKIKAKVEEVRTSSYGKYEFYVIEIRQHTEYVNNLQIHVRN